MADEWRFRIYEFTTLDGHSVIGEWMRNESVTERDRNLMVAKTDMLAIHGTELLGGLLAGPIKSKQHPRMHSHIYKLVIHGSVMLRPLLCKGPLDLENEFTFLLGAIETDDELDRDASEAETLRTILLQDPTRRVKNGRYK